MRILFATHAPLDPQTAVYLNVRRRADALRQRGHEVDVVGRDTLWFGSWPRVAPLLLPIGVLFERLSDYDVVVFHSYLGWAYHLWRGFRRGSPSPVSVTAFHGVEPLYFAALARELHRDGRRFSFGFTLLNRVLLPLLLRFTCRRSDAVFCLNQREAAYLAERTWASPERIGVMQNGVDLELLNVPAVRGHRRRLLFLGQWLPAKGIRYLVDAFATLAAELADVELVCAGTGVSREVVQAAFPESLRRRIIVRSGFARDELPLILQQADVFVFPSLSEGSSGAILEAMAAGLPMVVTRVGAAPDLLTDGTSALLVEPADADALANAVLRLLRDEALRTALGDAARDRARAFTWDAVNARFSEQLMSIHAGR